jgi:hypothetical protein
MAQAQQAFERRNVGGHALEGLPPELTIVGVHTVGERRHLRVERARRQAQQVSEAVPSRKLNGRGPRTPAAASRISASTSALCHAASVACLPKRVLLAIARAWRVFFTLRFSV